MFGKHMEPFRKTFVDQFQADGDGYVFRKGLRGAAVRVTAAERDWFIADFDRRLRRAPWILAAATVVIILAVVVGGVVMDLSESWMLILTTGATIAMVLIFATVLMRFYGEPARQLARRAPTAPALTRSEARKMALEQLTWAQIGTFYALAAFGGWRAHLEFNLLEGWGRLGLVFLVLVSALVAVQAYRKWRHDRQ